MPGNTIEFAQIAFGLVPEVLDLVDMIVTVGELFGMIDTNVREIGYVQHIIAPPAVRIDDAVRDYLSLNDRHQGSC